MLRLRRRREGRFEGIEKLDFEVKLL